MRCRFHFIDTKPSVHSPSLFLTLIRYLYVFVVVVNVVVIVIVAVVSHRHTHTLHHQPFAHSLKPIYTHCRSVTLPLCIQFSISGSLGFVFYCRIEASLAFHQNRNEILLPPDSFQSAFVECVSYTECVAVFFFFRSRIPFMFRVYGFRYT